MNHVGILGAQMYLDKLTLVLIKVSVVLLGCRSFTDLGPPYVHTYSIVFVCECACVCTVYAYRLDKI